MANESQLDRIENKLDRLLHILEGGKSTYDLHRKAQEILASKLDKIRRKELQKEKLTKGQTKE